MNGETKASTWSMAGKTGDTPVDSLVKPTFAEQCEMVAKILPDSAFRDSLAVLHNEMLEEIEKLQRDREWQIKQNVKMFTALEKISKAGASEYAWSSLQRMAKEGMVEAV